MSTSAPVGVSAPVGASGPVLEVDALSVDYGPARALFGVSLRLEPGASLAVLGANGAGKSTLGRALAGLVAPSGGRIRVQGRDVTGWSAPRLARLGIAYLPEERGIFPGLSVRENLAMFARLAPRRQRPAVVESALSLFPVLGDRGSQRAGSLSGGEQQLLALARVLARRPLLVVADEPGLGLAPLMIETVFAGLAEARSSGVALVVIEQFAHRALDLADDCVLLQRGMVAWSGPAAEAAGELVGGYLGDSGPD